MMLYDHMTDGELVTKGNGKVEMSFGYIQPHSEMGLRRVYLSQKEISEITGMSQSNVSLVLQRIDRIRTEEGFRYGTFYNAEDLIRGFSNDISLWKWFLEPTCYKEWIENNPKFKYLLGLDILDSSKRIWGSDLLQDIFGKTYITIISLLKRFKCPYYSTKGTPFVLFKIFVKYMVRDHVAFFRNDFKNIGISFAYEGIPMNDEYVKIDDCYKIIESLVSYKNATEETKNKIDNLLKYEIRPFIGSYKTHSELKEIFDILNEKSPKKITEVDEVIERPVISISSPLPPVQPIQTTVISKEVRSKIELKALLTQKINELEANIKDIRSMIDKL